MATTISIKVGNVTAERTFVNDAKAIEVLRLYAERLDVDPNATNKVKLQHVVDNLVTEIVRGGRAQHLDALMQAQVDATKAIGLE